MVAKPWLNSEGKPLLIDGAPALCESCPCDPPVFTDCCHTIGASYAAAGGLVKMPASAIQDACYDPGTFKGTGDWNFYNGLIVEVNGHTGSPCNANGSYFIPNSGGGALGSPHSTCRWFDILPFEDMTDCDPSRTIRISVSIDYSAFTGLATVVGSLNYGATLNPGFVLSYSAADIPDLSGPVEIPTSFGSTSPGFYQWDFGLPPLVIYLA